MIADSSYEESCVQLFSEKHRENTVTEALYVAEAKRAIFWSYVNTTDLLTYYANWATKSPRKWISILCQLVTFTVSGTSTCWLQIVCAGQLR